MKKFLKILPVFIIALSSLMMTGAEYFHTHADGANHSNDCPVCILNSNIHNPAYKPDTSIDSCFELRTEFTIDEFTVVIGESLFAGNTHGRAPPSA